MKGATAFGGNSADAAIKAVKMAFALQYHCHFGQNISILGSSACLGSWNTEQCVDMQWTEDDVWKVEVELPSVTSEGAAIEYKYVVRDQNGGIITWKPGENYMLQVPVENASIPDRVSICDAWDNSCRQIEIELDSATELEQGEPEISGNTKAANILKEQAEAAMQDLKIVVDKSTNILDSMDPISPEALAADRAVAAAAKRVQKLTRALNEYKRTGLLIDPSSLEE